MADSQIISQLIESTTSKIQQLEKAVTELEAHRTISLNLKWKELEEHFHGLERSLKKRFEELASKERDYEVKASEVRQMLEKRESFVVAKEQECVDRVQEKRSAAVAAIKVELDKHKEALQGPGNIGRTIGDAISNLDGKHMASPVLQSEKLEAKDSSSDSADISPRPELQQLCEEMDARGLHSFISDNRKNLGAIREEVPVALKSAADPTLLVLNSLEGFYQLEEKGSDGKVETNILGLRKTCIMLMESLSMLLKSEASKHGSGVSFISDEMKEKAKAVADEWKPKLDTIDINNVGGNSLEVHAFLQLLNTFSIGSQFNQDEICRFLPAISRRRQTAELCCSLGLLQQMPGFIKVLVNNGRHLEAINLAYAFQLTQQFPPVPLLKAYLKDVRKASHAKFGNSSPSANCPDKSSHRTHDHGTDLSQDESNNKELAAVKAVLKCIEEHRLEDEYGVEPLQKRLIQLEKAKAEKKRAVDSIKPQPKRPRANTAEIFYGPRFVALPDMNFFRIGYPCSYEPPKSNFYSQPMLQTSPPYMYPVDNHGYNATSPYRISPSHANYYGNGYHYQPTYMH